MKNIGVIGRIFFAIAVIASGALQLWRQEFVRLVPPLPLWITHVSAWADVTGALLLAGGLAIALNQKRRPAAIMLAVLFFVVLLLYAPGLLANPGAGYNWTNPCKTLALLGGCVLLTALPGDASAPNTNPSQARVHRAWKLSAFLWGIFFVVGGIQHFVYIDFVTQLVPAFMPGRRGWAFFTGTALVAGGIGVNWRRTAFPAALLSGLMIFLWVILLHIPRALAAPQNPGETSAIFEALAFSGIAFLLAGTKTSGLPFVVISEI